jgi:peptide/nickel transport system permease protein
METILAAGLGPDHIPARRTFFSGFWRTVRKNPPGALAGLFCIMVVVMAILGPQIAPYGADVIGFPHLEPPSWSYPFGTDNLTRDIFSRIIIGARNSVGIGFGAVLLATFVGSAAGITMGYFGGWWDQATGRLIDVALAFPSLVFIIFFLSIFPPSFLTVSLAIGIVLTPGTARVIRSATLAVRNQVYVEAAIVLGNSPFNVIRRHILPNVAAAVIIMSTLQIGTAILAEAAISFIGLGISSAAQPSWGQMLQEMRPVWQLAWWTSIVPGLAISLTVLCFNLAGDALRDALDPRMRGT